MTCSLVARLGLILSSHPSHLELHVQCLHSLVDHTSVCANAMVSFVHCWRAQKQAYYLVFCRVLDMRWLSWSLDWKWPKAPLQCFIRQTLDGKGRNGLLTWCCLLPPAPQISAPTPNTHNPLFLWPLLLGKFSATPTLCLSFCNGRNSFWG